MEPKRLLKTAIIPALIELEPFDIKDSPEAQRFMLAIALQESGIKNRRQMNNGPAASYWQWEKTGGCYGALNHKTVGPMMRAVCDKYDIEATPLGLWTAMQYQDIVAACAARLLIYTLPNSLPQTADDGWAQYLRAWRPGKPRPDSWDVNWSIADAAVKEVI